MERFTIEEVVDGQDHHNARYEILDNEQEEIIAVFYFKWFLASDVLKICQAVRLRIDKAYKQ